MKFASVVFGSVLSVVVCLPNFAQAQNYSAYPSPSPSPFVCCTCDAKLTSDQPLDDWYDICHQQFQENDCDAALIYDPDFNEVSPVNIPFLTEEDVYSNCTDYIELTGAHGDPLEKDEVEEKVEVCLYVKSVSPFLNDICYNLDTCSELENEDQVYDWIDAMKHKIPPGMELKVIGNQCTSTNDSATRSRCIIAATCEEVTKEYDPCNYRGSCITDYASDDIQCELPSGEISTKRCCGSYSVGYGDLYTEGKWIKPDEECEAPPQCNFGSLCFLNYAHGCLTEDGTYSYRECVENKWAPPV